MRKLYFFLGVVLVAMLLTSCKKEVTGISLDKSTLTLEVGEWQMLTAKVLPKKATDKSVSWLSLNDNIASVADGVIIGNIAGATTVIAKAGNYTATCEVTVKPPLLAGTTWKGVDTDGRQCTLTLTNSTNCELSIKREYYYNTYYDNYSGTYSIVNYPNILVQFVGWNTFSGTIISNQMTLTGGGSFGTYGMVLTKE